MVRRNDHSGQQVGTGREMTLFGNKGLEGPERVRLRKGV